MADGAGLEKRRPEAREGNDHLRGHGFQVSCIVQPVLHRHRDSRTQLAELCARGGRVERLHGDEDDLRMELRWDVPGPANRGDPECPLRESRDSEAVARDFLLVHAPCDRDDLIVLGKKRCDKAPERARADDEHSHAHELSARRMNLWLRSR